MEGTGLETYFAGPFLELILSMAMRSPWTRLTTSSGPAALMVETNTDLVESGALDLLDAFDDETWRRFSLTDRFMTLAFVMICAVQLTTADRGAEIEEQFVDIVSRLTDRVMSGKLSISPMSKQSHLTVCPDAAPLNMDDTPTIFYIPVLDPYLRPEVQAMLPWDTPGTGDDAPGVAKATDHEFYHSEGDDIPLTAAKQTKPTESPFIEPTPNMDIDDDQAPEQETDVAGSKKPVKGKKGRFAKKGPRGANAGAGRGRGRGTRGAKDIPEIVTTPAPAEEAEEAGPSGLALAAPVPRTRSGNLRGTDCIL